MSRILVTGAAGLIGSHLVRQLIADGREVHAVVRPGGDRRRLADVADSVHLVEGDLRHPATLAPALAAIMPASCVHAGWIAEPGRYLASPENVELLHGSLQLIELLAAHGCRRIVGVGTCFEYDTFTDAGALSETSPLRPRHLYAACKAGLGVAFAELARARGMSGAWARVFYLHGPGEDERRVVPAVARALLRGDEAPTTGGAQVRDYLHVEDVAAAVRAVEPSAIEGPINVGSGEPVTLRTLLTTLAETVGRPELVRFGALPYAATDPMRVCADNRRLLAETAWRPRFDLAAGLAHTVDWLRAHPAGAA